MTPHQPGAGPAPVLGAYVRRRLGALVAVLLVGTLTACGGGGSPEGGASPAERLAAAEQRLDETSGLRVRLTSEGLDQGITGVTSAEGVAAHPPAFQGTLSVQLVGQSVEVPVISVNDTVYAILPFTTGWSKVNPAEYGAPDPAALLRTDGGLSAMLVGTKNLSVAGEVRGGKNNTEVLTEITGTLPASLVTAIIPSASGSFDVTYRLTDDNTLREVTLTGSFYPDAAGETTYTVTLTDYGIDPEIAAPKITTR